ncbi:MAG: amidohydrolase [Phycisphaerae bacterium]|nr:amidohydrolase [Phycisphaerae bacterium]
MIKKRLNREDFKDKVIDCHSHVGVEIKLYCRGEYPYAQTAEGIYYKQLSSGVDVNVVFPFSVDLYCEPTRLLAGERIPAKKPLSDVPYKVENQILMREIFDYCPELSSRFIPFTSVDPARDVSGQLDELKKLDEKYPIYGIKVNPVGCQSKVLELLGKGKAFLDFAAQRDIPFIFHSTTVPNDEYSQASDIFKIVERRPELRFCFAHCLLFNEEFFEHAKESPNVWVDTAALKIQVDLVNQLVEDKVINRSTLIDVDFSDYRKVMRTFCQMYPDMIIWGTDSPAYTYHCLRKQGKDSYQEFAYKGTYSNELEALNSLTEELRRKVSNSNTIDFIFGKKNKAMVLS